MFDLAGESLLANNVMYSTVESTAVKLALCGRVVKFTLMRPSSRYPYVATYYPA